MLLNLYFSGIPGGVVKGVVSNPLFQIFLDPALKCTSGAVYIYCLCNYNLFMCKVQGDTYRPTILLLLSPVVLQEVDFFYPKAETVGHSHLQHGSAKASWYYTTNHIPVIQCLSAVLMML